MKVEDFSALDYKNKLQTVNRKGKLRLTFNVDEYEISLYKVQDFYVELVQ